MFKISAGVGYGQKNNPQDVATVQMALKLAKAGSYGSIKTPYFARRIDGIYSSHLASAISAFKEAYFSEQELSQLTSQGESVSAISGSQSKTYMRLWKSLPADYQAADYGYAKIRNRTVVYQKNKSKQSAVNYRADDLSLPNDLAQALIGHLELLFQGYSLIPTIEKITVDHDGRFNVRVGVKGGLIIDAESAKVISVSDKDKSYAVSFFDATVNNSSMPSKRVWRFTGKSEIIFTSKKQYSFLKSSAGGRVWLLWQLGSHKTKHQAQVVETALDAYDRFRLGAKLPPETQQFMIAVFGDDWQQIKDQQAIKEQRASEYKEQIKELKNIIDLRRKRLLSLENKLRENLGIERTDFLGNLLTDLTYGPSNRVTKQIGSRVKKSVGKKLVSDTSFEKSANKAVGKSVANFVELTVSTVFSPPDDITDTIVFGLGVVSIALLALGGALILAGAGTAAVVVGTAATVARVGSVVVKGVKMMRRALEFTDVAVTVYERVADLLRDQQLDEELSILESEIGPAQNALTDSIEELNILIAAVKSEQLVTLADFGFSQTELDIGIKQLEAISAS